MKELSLDSNTNGPLLSGNQPMSDHSHDSSDSNRPLLTAIVVITICYALATMAGWTTFPEVAHEAESQVAHADAHAAADAVADSGDHHAVATPDFYAVVPFVLLLGAIAVLPLLKATEHWWENNLNRFIVSIGLASVTLVYYLVLYSDAGFGAAWHRIDHAILIEYIPFIVLLFSLYVISGGIRIDGDMRAHPMTNATFMLVGGLLASFIGTTGAAMLLIRPLIETNKERKHVQHSVVFFIFIVCNCGGCLLPIGDPPLFLGYLEGVDFMWTFFALWQPWIMVNLLLLGIYLALDQFYFYPKETAQDVKKDIQETKPLRIRGLMPNALLLLGIVLSVALLDPKKVIPYTNWHPWIYLREMVQLVLVGMSLWLGSKRVRSENRFNYHAIIEVAALFVGIFICMQPALELLNEHGSSLGINSPQKFFWITGGLSAMLDNAPTYLVFFRTANPDLTNMVAGGEDYLNLVAISLGSVFMGAMTYIGNGPNFMVRAIAEESGVRMPSFFGYVIYYSLPILLPVMVVMALFFL